VITINERVQVPSPPDVVWSVISDPSKVVGCIEGSELREHHDDGSFDALLAVKFAAIKVKFGARASLDLDEEQRIGRLEATGSDSRGSTRVGGHAQFVVQPEGAGSVVDIDGVIELNGQLASLVTTGATVVVTRMTRTFAARLAAVCAELDPPTVPPAGSAAVHSAAPVGASASPASATPVPASATPVPAAPSPVTPADDAPASAPTSTKDRVAAAPAAAPESFTHKVFTAVLEGIRRTVQLARHRLQALNHRRRHGGQTSGQPSRQHTGERT